MNEGARQANHEADVSRAAQQRDTEISLLKEIRDLLKCVEQYGPALSKVRDGVGGIVPHGPVFHWRDGWYFCRGECLDVHIWNIDPRVELTIPANEWDSIVAHLKD